jgi:hypothetical protein
MRVTKPATVKRTEEKRRSLSEFLQSVRATATIEEQGGIDWLVAVLDLHPRMVDALRRITDGNEETVADDLILIRNILIEVDRLP